MFSDTGLAHIAFIQPGWALRFRYCQKGKSNLERANLILIAGGRNCSARLVLALGFIPILHPLHPLSLSPALSHSTCSQAGLGQFCYGFVFHLGKHHSVDLPQLARKGRIIFCYVVIEVLHASAGKQIVKHPWTIFAQSAIEKRNLILAFRFSSFLMCFIWFSLHTLKLSFLLDHIQPKLLSEICYQVSTCSCLKVGWIKSWFFSLSPRLSLCGSEWQWIVAPLGDKHPHPHPQQQPPVDWKLCVGSACPDRYQYLVGCF